MADNGSLAKSPRVDDWIDVAADGRVYVRSGKVDIGQKVTTALALIAAEELDVPLERIEMVRAETGLAPDEGITSGSYSMDQSGNAIRLAGATARRHLLRLAAKKMGVEPASLETGDGLVRSRATNQTMSYAELLDGAPFGIAVDLEIESKKPSDYRYVGKPGTTARDMAAIAIGSHRYVHDMQMPGMKHARVVRPPHYHATLAGLDETIVARLTQDGIDIVRDGSFLAVAATDEYAATKAAERLANAAKWDLGPGLDEGDIYAKLHDNPRLSLPVMKGGMPKKEPVPPLGPPPADAAATLSARYERPYTMHASIGPSAAAALFENNRLTIWSHSQGIYVLRQALAEALDMDADAVTVAHGLGAGCYGHNGADDVALDAALVARTQPGTPVLLKWTRADEHAWEPYTSCMSMDLRASLDSGGNVMAWSHESYSDTHNSRPRSSGGKAGAARLLASRFRAAPNHIAPPVAEPLMGPHVGIHRNLEPLYDFANQRLVKNLVRDMPLRTSAMRTLGGFSNVFAIESFVDELAEAANADPVEFRLRHLSDERGRAVVERVGEWMAQGTVPAGHGRGMGFARYKQTMAYVAVGIEVAVTEAAEVKLLRAFIAGDAGQAVDPDGLAAQLEGGLMQAASWALYEQVQFDRDGISSRDWETYPILRFDNVPEIETVLIDRAGYPFLGAGEASSGPAAGAIANAVRNASGLRLRRIPFTPANIRAAALA